MKSKSIGILTKPKFPEVKATVHAVVNWLRDRKIDVILDTYVGHAVERARRRAEDTIGPEGGCAPDPWR